MHPAGIGKVKNFKSASQFCDHGIIVYEAAASCQRGAPVYIDREGQKCIVAVHFAGGDHSNFGTLITPAVLSWIRTCLEQE